MSKQTELSQLANVSRVNGNSIFLEDNGGIFFDDGGSYARGVYSAGTDVRIQTNAMNRLQVDSAGRVTMPYQPAFFATNMSAVAGGYLHNGTVRLTRGGMSYNNGAGQLTVPVSGVYRISGTAFTNSPNKGVMLQVYVNGVHYAASEGFASSGTFTYDGATVSVIGQLSASDYVSIHVNGISTGVYNGGGGNTLTVELIG